MEKVNGLRLVTNRTGIFSVDYKILHMPVKRHSIIHIEKSVRARTFELFYRGRE
jgi:hypothetical protein